MNETSIDLALIWRLVRRRKAALLVLAVLGACVGAALSLVLSPGYVSTSKVLLQGSRNPNEVPVRPAWSPACGPAETPRTSTPHPRVAA